MSSALVNIVVRPITSADDPAIAAVIRQVSAEFGLTADKGYTVSDPDLDVLSKLYGRPRSAYWVIEYRGQVAGGGGIAPLSGAAADICELQKMYFMPVLRGRGIAHELAVKALTFAQGQGFRRCYLETTASLTRAIALYERLGFTHIKGPMGSTGHVDCEVHMLREL
ncbi:GNAT family N-acetyltransferase [Martelella alba]|uniref:GNAT family N-acetyltransferase n=1 Tax=Martelella alba TaxID=2590451 RepID=A0ABY2SE61_9HYPH|nr:GNAT family N-acetyltransferase [Martelella alba]TKI02985.1 GNAT family N-acetyltransferase [Martelella alba]